MARGRKQNFKKPSKHFKSSRVSKKVKPKYDRDIKHRNLSVQSVRQVESKRVNDLEDFVEEPEDAVKMLLSTFSGGKEHYNVVSESEEEEEIDDEMEPREEKNENDFSFDGDEMDGSLSGSDVGEHSFIQVAEEEINVNDPFLEHFNLNLSPSMVENLQNAHTSCITTSLNWSQLEKVKIEIPTEPNATSPAAILEDECFAKCATVPQRINKIDLNALFVKHKLQNNLQSNGKEECFTELQKELFSIINNYQDVFYPNRVFENIEEVRFMYSVHIVNHILKCRTLVLNHNEKIEDPSTGEFRDQGLVRPRVLILCPFRDSCYRIVNNIAKLLLGEIKANVINMLRFKDEFTGNELALPKKNRKPEDFEATFSGNVDDNFKIGLAFTKKSLKLYTDFYSSDIIVASPLGLRMLVGAEGESDRDYDFLSSIEILILDQAEIFLMQNWDHVTHILNHLHLQPRESHGTDFSRVRTWALNGWAKNYRQTLLFSTISAPEFNAVFSRHCKNFAGSARILNAANVGSISRVIVPLPHVYRRFQSTSVVATPDDRFQAFITDILPQLSEIQGVLLYVPSYFDFVRLRNYLRNQDFSFVQICEYSKDGKVARARDMFYHNEARLLLYSERFHFFRRIYLKGIRHVIFYQPPTFPLFYSEICNLMQESNQNKVSQDVNFSVTVLFCQYDVHQLAGIVRSVRAERIVKSEKSVHMFTTGE